ncbi:hypothetical protein U1Q18_044358 [Sarracenia purpurea var. burkii]
MRGYAIVRIRTRISRDKRSPLVAEGLFANEGQPTPPSSSRSEASSAEIQPVRTDSEAVDPTSRSQQPSSLTLSPSLERAACALARSAK